MKSLIVSGVIAVCIIVGSIFYSNYINDLSKEMCNYGNEIKTSIAEENYSKAVDKISLLEAYIDKKKPALASTSDHCIPDSIEKDIAELRVYTSMKQKSDALAKCELLNFHFEHIPKGYKLKLENIL